MLVKSMGRKGSGLGLRLLFCTSRPQKVHSVAQGGEPRQAVGGADAEAAKLPGRIGEQGSGGNPRRFRRLLLKTRLH
ncbi:MAG TPA: hypothetical protein VGC15_07910 [Acetobacteraceae bacterium]